MNSINYEKLKPFFEVLQNESDRACAVLAGALLETQLDVLLRRRTLKSVHKEVFEGYGPLSTFSAKIDVAYGLGAISKEEHRDLHLVRKTRNDFAHAVDHDLSFETQAMTQRVGSMALPKILFEHPSLSMSVDTPRQRFQIGVGILNYLMTGKRLETSEKPSEPSSLSDEVFDA